MAITTYVFDAYGTLFDVAAAARRTALEPGRKEFAKSWVKVATDWWLKQLQYTRLHAIMTAHTGFWAVTRMFSTLKSNELNTAILPNGSPAMLEGVTKFGSQTVWVSLVNDPQDQLPWAPKAKPSTFHNFPNLAKEL